MSRSCGFVEDLQFLMMHVQYNLLRISCVDFRQKTTISKSTSVTSDRFYRWSFIANSIRNFQQSDHSNLCRTL